MTQPFPPNAKIAVYLRDSGGEEQELSVHQQKAELLAWAANHQLLVTRVFVDEAVTAAATIGRDQFHAMLAHFRADPEEAGVVVWKFSRFARNQDDSQFYRADLRRRGYIVHSLQDQIPQGADGRLFEAAVDWMNERFLKDLSEDVKRGLHYNLIEHGAVPGKIPHGFRGIPVQIGRRRDGSPRIAQRWEPDPEKIDAVRLAYEMRASGASYRAIAEATQLYTSKNSFVSFFPNKIYKGVLEYGGLVLEDYCEPIVTPELWDSAQRVSKERRNAATVPNEDNPRRLGSDYLLSGLVYCQECGSPMNAHTIGGAKRYQYYACSRRKRRGDCTAAHIPRHALEKAVTDKLISEALTVENLLLLQNKLDAEAERDTSSEKSAAKERGKRLQKIEQELANLTTAIQAGGYTRTMTEAIRKLETEQDKLLYQNQQAAITPTLAKHPRATLAQLAAELTESLKSKNPAERRAALRSVITRVTIRKDGKRLVGVLSYLPRSILYLRVVPPRRRHAEDIKLKINFITQ
jgi:site-specific DNA recombinase